MEKILFFLIVYSFLGWSFEMIYNIIKSGKIRNTGFLLGPFSPIYGFGALGIVYIDYLFKNISIENTFVIGILVLIISFLYTTVLEYITGFLLYKIFKIKWWDYTDFKYNIKGYVCLRYSLYWTILSIFLLYGIHPFVINIVENGNKIIFYLIFILIIIDFVYTVIKLYSFKNIIEFVLDEADRKISVFKFKRKKIKKEMEVVKTEAIKNYKRFIVNFHKSEYKNSNILEKLRDDFFDKKKKK